MVAQYSQISPNVHHIHLPQEDKYGTEYKLILSSGGAYGENPHETGITHLLEHCMISVVDQRSTVELNADLQDKLIARNASTSKLVMNVRMEGHREDSEEMWRMLLQAGLNPAFREDVFKQEKKIVLSEIVEQTGSNRFKVDSDIKRAIFEDGSLGVLEVLGNQETVSRVTFEDIQRRHKLILQRSHMVFVTIGGLMSKEVLAQDLRRVVQQYQPSEFLDPIEFAPPSGFRNFDFLPVVHPGAHAQADIRLGIPCEVTFGNSPDRAMFFEALIDGPNGTLYNRLRNELGIIYSLDSSSLNGDSLVHIGLTSNVENVRTVIEAIQQILEDPKSRFTNAQLDKIRMRARKRSQLASDDPRNRLGQIQSNLFTYGIFKTFDDYLVLVHETTPEKVNVLLDNLAQNFANKKLVVISKNPEIKNIFRKPGIHKGMSLRRLWPGRS